ncbi:hypothetical protein PV779_66170, partial [Streptomyces sp. ID01-9D]|nr:hypothetical protein [Streptomyces sp. ID01-9D]
ACALLSGRPAPAVCAGVRGGTRTESPGGAAGTAGAPGVAEADRTGIAAGGPCGADACAGTTGPEPGVVAGPWPGARSGSGRVPVPGDVRSPSSGASPPSRAVGGSEGSGVPIPPRTRAREPPEASGRDAGEEVVGVAPPGAGARCTEGADSEGVDGPDVRADWDGWADRDDWGCWDD